MGAVKNYCFIVDDEPICRWGLNQHCKGAGIFEKDNIIQCNNPEELRVGLDALHAKEKDTMNNTNILVCSDGHMLGPTFNDTVKVMQEFKTKVEQTVTGWNNFLISLITGNYTSTETTAYGVNEIKDPAVLTASDADKKYPKGSINSAEIIGFSKLEQGNMIKPLLNYFRRVFGLPITTQS